MSAATYNTGGRRSTVDDVRAGVNASSSTTRHATCHRRPRSIDPRRTCLPLASQPDRAGQRAQGRRRVTPTASTWLLREDGGRRSRFDCRPRASRSPDRLPAKKVPRGSSTIAATLVVVAIVPDDVEHGSACHRHRTSHPSHPDRHRIVQRVHSRAWADGGLCDLWPLRTLTTPQMLLNYLIRAFWKEREEQQAGSVRPDAIHACISADCDRAGYRPTTLDSDDHPRRAITCP